jgi:type II secretion system protein N
MKLPRIAALEGITIPARVQRVLKLSGYPIFYLLCLLLFAYWTFPYDRLRERILVELEAQRGNSPTAQHVEIDSLGPYWLSGVMLKGIRLITPRVLTSEGEKLPSRLSIDEAHARVSLLPLLIGRVTLNFGAKAFGGRVDGFTRVGSEGRTIEASLEEVDVGQIETISNALGGLPLSGAMNGKLELVLPEQKLGKANGSISLAVTELTAGDGKTKIAGKLSLPKLNVGAFDLEAEAKDGILRFSKLGAQGQDLDLVGEGKISLREAFGDSLADLYLRFRFAEGYKNKNELTKSLFGSAGSSMPALFELADPRIKSSKRPDGYYSWHMTGPLKDARFEPAPTASSGGGSGAGRAK